MIVSGILYAPDGTPYANQAVRLTANLTSASVLKTATSDFFTTETGYYSVDVPNGKYRVSISRPSIGYVDIGIITIQAGTPESTINDLMMIEQTVSPRDPLLDQILQAIADGGGTDGRQRFIWPQNIPLEVWTIPHNLNAFPSVTVVDSTGSVVGADVSYIDSNMVQVTFGASYTGKAYLN